jgi:hypothetical protein
VTLKQCSFNAEKRPRGGIPNIQIGGAEMGAKRDRAQYVRTEALEHLVLETT